ncbi:nuclease-related domain-containing protein [Alicyclobacillus sp. ALC3]|uniref:nuclease-related domain-containing protein n=1 Tax=Alicyclobacillus sp. ALC3 TaxID=2796143 RepID=UPI0023790DD1|nr:nuclease-related domain-containing protein [Alicyclobacillus sp. ALC3]WDL99787.1 NERD domain-containing protein [Alicyclobacillus sp. ALC3]
MEEELGLYFIVILPILIVIVVVLKILDNSRKFTGVLGEQGVRVRLSKLDKSRHLILNDVMIPKPGGGTSQIDHVIVCRAGVIAVETKNWAGAVYGRGTDQKWTVAVGRRKYRQHNPVLQNKGHVRALREIVGFNIPLHSVISFGSRASLRVNDTGDTHVVESRNLVRTITAIDSEILTVEQMHNIYQRVAAANITNSDTRKQHVKDIHQRYTR